MKPAGRSALQGWRRLGQLAEEKGTGRLRLLRELRRLRRATGISLDEYAYYGLHDPSREWSWKRTFIGVSRQRRLWRQLNPTRYWGLFHDKLVFKRLFAGQGFPLAETLGVFDPTAGWVEEGGPLRSADDLLGLLKQRMGPGVVIKHVEGARGWEVISLVGWCGDEPETLRTIDGRALGVSELEAQLLDHEAARWEGRLPPTWLVEERLLPHPEIARLSGPTLSTLRLQTLVGRSGRPELIGGVLKVPDSPRAVDNLQFGGVAIWIDLDTGSCARARSTEYATPAWHDVLPWSGERFVGLAMPFWKEATDLVLRAARVVPWARCIGWDVAITPRGPVLVEGNERWSVRMLQAAAPRGLRVGELAAFCEGG